MALFLACKWWLVKIWVYILANRQVNAWLRAASQDFGVVWLFLSFAPWVASVGFKKTRVKSQQQSFSLAKLSLSYLQQFGAPGFSTRKIWTSKRLAKRKVLMLPLLEEILISSNNRSSILVSHPNRKINFHHSGLHRNPTNFSLTKTTYSAGCIFEKTTPLPFFPIPYHPCMVYLPTFGWFLW